MATVADGADAVVDVSPGNVLVVTTAGKARVDRVYNLAGAGYAADRIVAGEQLYYAERDIKFTVKIFAVDGIATYFTRLPDVPSWGVNYRRDSSGDIKEMVDLATGDVFEIHPDPEE